MQNILKNLLQFDEELRNIDEEEISTLSESTHDSMTDTIYLCLINCVKILAHICIQNQKGNDKFSKYTLYLALICIENIIQNNFSVFDSTKYKSLLQDKGYLELILGVLDLKENLKIKL